MDKIAFSSLSLLFVITRGFGSIAISRLAASSLLIQLSLGLSDEK
jgi:hypothetical protein